MIHPISMARFDECHKLQWLTFGSLWITTFWRINDDSLAENIASRVDELVFIQYCLIGSCDSVLLRKLRNFLLITDWFIFMTKCDWIDYLEVKLTWYTINIFIWLFLIFSSVVVPIAWVVALLDHCLVDDLCGIMSASRHLIFQNFWIEWENNIAHISFCDLLFSIVSIISTFSTCALFQLFS